MVKLRVRLDNNKEIMVNKGTKLNEIVKHNYSNGELPIVLGKLNGKFYELITPLQEEGIFQPVDIKEKSGIKAYIRTLQFVLIKATLDLYPEAKVIIEHSLNKGIFGEIYKDNILCKEDIEKIKNRMKKIIKKDIPIRQTYKSKEEAIDIFHSYGMTDKVKLLKSINLDVVKLYELEGRYDYFYGYMAYSTGILKNFDLMYYKPGFILKFPTEDNPYKLPKFIEHRKLSKIFYETEKWGHILEVGDVGSLNEKVENKDIFTIIRVAEALHEKKIAYIADMISERKDVKLVSIAGPSSSGKTTFSKRLGIQLKVNGLTPVFISLDDYFVDREYTPRDEKGEYDFESIYALDLELFNKNLGELFEGKEVEIPTFNFKKGKREWRGEKISFPYNGIIIIEGIHGLNEILTSSVPLKNKFKIYISALTQLNLDNHNRISTTDVRTVRRIVRDYLFRGCSAEQTLKMWPSIRRGEEKNIFVFQENADVMFNSTLVYELCVLKDLALQELKKIDSKSPVYYEALRLQSFLYFFKSIGLENVPDNSILREFIGGSCFYKK